MRKLTLLVAGLAVAALPSTADAAKKARKRAAPPQAAAQPANPNEAGGRFVRDAVPVFLPTWALPFYLSQQRTGPHGYWYYNGQPQPQAQPQRNVRRVKHASAKRTAQ